MQLSSPHTDKKLDISNYKEPNIIVRQQNIIVRRSIFIINIIIMLTIHVVANFFMISEEIDNKTIFFYQCIVV